MAYSANAKDFLLVIVSTISFFEQPGKNHGFDKSLLFDACALNVYAVY